MAQLIFVNTSEDDIIQLPGGYPVYPGKTAILDDAKDGRIDELLDTPAALRDFFDAVGRIPNLVFLGSSSVIPGDDGGVGTQFSTTITTPGDIDPLTFQVPLDFNDWSATGVATASVENAEEGSYSFTITDGDNDTTVEVFDTDGLQGATTLAATIEASGSGTLEIEIPPYDRSLDVTIVLNIQPD